MKFGDKIRALRHERNLTQPELAETLGIEQSYLSKLENDKSLPSNDVLNRILDVFGLGVGELVDDLDQGARNQLRQLPDVAAHIDRQKRLMIGNRRRWLALSAVLFSLGLAMIYAGSVHLFFPNVVYQYMSHGVVRDGEPKEIFRHTQEFIPESGERDEAIAFLDSIKARIDEDFLLESTYRGSVFNVAVAGGSRTYYIDGDVEIDPWQSKLVVFLGVLMSALGLIGLLLDRKLSRL